jgi:hypothetical protein
MCAASCGVRVCASHARALLWEQERKHCARRPCSTHPRKRPLLRWRADGYTTCRRMGGSFVLTVDVRWGQSESHQVCIFDIICLQSPPAFWSINSNTRERLRLHSCAQRTRTIHTDVQWTVASSMQSERHYHSQSTLADGRVLVCGGQAADSSVLASTEIFDPDTNTWTTAAPMPQAQALHSQSTLADGRVLVCYVGSACIYDPATNAWAATPSSEGDLYGGHSQSTLHDGRAFACLKDISTIYNPHTITWMAAAPMRKARQFHSQSTLADGRVLVCGGQIGMGDTADAEIYNPDTNTWATAAPMPQSLSFHSQSTLADGRVLVCGEGTANIYDPVTNTWTAAPQLPQSGFSIGHSQSTLADGRVLVCGGHSNPNGATMMWILETNAPVVACAPLPPTPSTEAMSQAEKASALREWLSAAETIREKEQQQAKRAKLAIELRYKFNVFTSQVQLQEEIRKATAQHDARVTTSAATRDDQLKRCCSAKPEQEQQFSRVQGLYKEANLFLEFLKERSATSSSSSSTPTKAVLPPTERPHEHMCSITHEVMEDPVMVVSCGDTFERSAIEEWFRSADTCPFCRAKSTKVVVANKAIKKLIQDWSASTPGAAGSAESHRSKRARVSE